jgi:hypothetical protein
MGLDFFDQTIDCHALQHLRSGGGIVTLSQPKLMQKSNGVYWTECSRQGFET